MWPWGDPSQINSGIELRGVPPWQAAILEHKWNCGLWGVLHPDVPAQKQIQDLGKVVRPTPRMDNPPGQWSDVDVRIDRNEVTVFMNGRDHIEDVDPKFANARGIGLQAHLP